MPYIWFKYKFDNCNVCGFKYKFGIILAIDQLNAQILVFLMSLLHSSTCFEHYCARNM